MKKELLLYGLFSLVSGCKEGIRITSIPELQIKRTFNLFEPVLAVRAMGCINCHAKGTSVVTDFGKGSSHEMEASYFSGNHHESEGWSLSHFSKITVPSISSQGSSVGLNRWAVAQAAQGSCEPGRHQEFAFESLASGYYRIRSVFTGLYLYAQAAETNRPLYFSANSNSNSNHINWKLEEVSSNVYRFRSQISNDWCVVVQPGTKDRWAPLKMALCNDGSLEQKFKRVPSNRNGATFQIKPQHNSNPDAYCLEVPGGDYSDPKEAIRKFIHKRIVVKNPNAEVNVLDKAPFIGAPDRRLLLENLNQENSKDDWFYLKNTWTSADLNKNPSRNGNFFEIKGDLTCDGDLAFKKPLVIKDLTLTTLNGCRIYVVGPVFQQGPITYVSSNSQVNRTNLQIISSDFISQGIGTTHCETTGSFSWYLHHGASVENNPLKMRLTTHRPPLRAEYFADRDGYWDFLKNDVSKMDLQDASCRGDGDPRKTNLERRTLTFERLLLVAPMVQSRYIGNFKGVIIAEFANFTLSQFDFTFDSVFRDPEVGVLPLVPSQQYLEIAK